MAKETEAMIAEPENTVEAAAESEAYQEPDVTIFLPEVPGDVNNFDIVTWNMKRYKILRGVPVAVPAELARIIRHAQEERQKGKIFIEKKLAEAEEHAKRI